MNQNSSNSFITETYANCELWDSFHFNKLREKIYQVFNCIDQVSNNHEKSTKYYYLYGSTDCHYLFDFYDQNSVRLDFYIYMNIIKMTKKQLIIKINTFADIEKITAENETIIHLNQNLSDLHDICQIIKSINVFIRQKIKNNIIEDECIPFSDNRDPWKSEKKGLHIHDDWIGIREFLNEQFELSLWIIYYRLEKLCAEKSDSRLEIIIDLENIMVNCNGNIFFNDVEKIILFLLIKAAMFLSLNQRQMYAKYIESKLAIVEEKLDVLIYEENLSILMKRLESYKEELMKMNSKKLTFDILLECCQMIKNFEISYNNNFNMIKIIN